jgi:hypothetical protein
MSTTSPVISRPDKSEYVPYYEKYISLVPGNDVLTSLRSQGKETSELLSSVSEQKGDYRYAPDKWSVKEVVGHLSDTERIFNYRALRISRNDPTPLEGFEQDDYVSNGSFGQSSLRDLVENLANVRQATISLFRQLSEEAWSRRGVANNAAVSVRALAYIIAGHELHHRKILKEKYFRDRA